MRTDDSQKREPTQADKIIRITGKDLNKVRGMREKIQNVYIHKQIEYGQGIIQEELHAPTFASEEVGRRTVASGS